MNAIGAFFLFLLLLVLGFALLALDAYVVMLNVNDIAKYLAAGQPAPFWPFFWILLFAGGTAFAGSKAK